MHTPSLSSTGLSRVFDAVRKPWFWVLPLVAMALLSLVGWFIGSTLEHTVKHDLEHDLTTILAADLEALTSWIDAQKTNIEVLVGQPEVHDAILGIINSSKGIKGKSLKKLPDAVRFHKLLRPVCKAYGYAYYNLTDENGRFVATTGDKDLGLDLPKLYQELFQQIHQGKTLFVKPHRTSYDRPDGKGGTVHVSVPIMFFAVPIFDGKRFVGSLGVGVRPEKNFSRILQVARSGRTGETYAFNDQGLLLSQSRFEDQLRAMGLLEDNRDSVLNIEIRDPSKSLQQGIRADAADEPLPLTKMAASAIAARELGDNSLHFDVDGYNDYRGVPVIGAWKWLPEYDFGVATEAEVAEAHAPLIKLRRIFWSLFALLGATSLAILVSTSVMTIMQRRMRHVEREIAQLGQYQLEAKIGEGGMGEVYRAHHALLRRPTAIKLLRSESSSEKALARFEREVRLSSQLNHPNTIQIYDYGRTPEGIFYYAMELLDGVDLERLVKHFGPLPDGRVRKILLQVCGSLSEAHGIGLIHRDIKPANLMINRRGGQNDVVKVLDFGLVQSMQTPQDRASTISMTVAGTPLYLSPEAIELPTSVDRRSDLYSLAAVGYFLLTGEPVFTGKNSKEICQQHVHADPIWPSARADIQISPAMESLILECLAKDPFQRPSSAEELAERLEKCTVTTPWTARHAKQWWDENAQRLPVQVVGQSETVGTENSATILLERTLPG